MIPYVDNVLVPKQKSEQKWRARIHFRAIQIDSNPNPNPPTVTSATITITMTLHHEQSGIVAAQSVISSQAILLP